MQCVLNVAFADNSEVTYRFDGDLAERVVFLVGEGLRRRDDGRFSRMDTHRVQIFHVAYGYAIVCRVAHDLVFDLLPSVQIFFDKNLRHRTKERRKFLRKLSLAPYNTRSFAAECEPRPQHDGEPDISGGTQRLLNRSLSSVSRIVFTGVPSTRTPYFFSMPLLSSSRPRFSAV